MSPTSGTPRNIVLLAADGISTNIVFNTIQRQHRLSGVIIEERVSRRQYLTRRARRLGYGEVAGQVLFQMMVPPLLRKMSRRRITEITEDFGLDTAPIPQSRVIRVTSANSPQTHALLERLAPDIIVINGTRILTAETLTAVPARFVNVHTGITPRYRGVHGGYWALASSDAGNFGVTLHEVDSGLDTGPILHQARIVTTRRDNFVTYPLLQLGLAMPLLLEHLASPGTGTAAVEEGASRAWSHPTLWGYLRTGARTGVW
ncbi:MAG: formyl transferase [Chloroflexota bacterium]|nr:formyl transferase [Chloroflexota bacterium]